MNDQFTGILFDTLKVLIGILLGVIIGDPIKRVSQRFWDKWEKKRDNKNKAKEKTRPRPKFRVTQLCESDKLFDFSSVFKEQNRNQDIVLFEVDDFRRSVRFEEAVELKKIKTLTGFLEKVSALLAQMRRETWQGLSDRSPDIHFTGRREIIITNIPLPRNFYGCNSKDRNFLLISTAPVSPLFSLKDGPTIEDFIMRMTQRMTIFSIVPSLVPKNIHSGTSTGCLFDFTILLQGVVDVVKKPYICQTCRTNIIEEQGLAFYEQLSSWMKLIPSGSKMDSKI